MSILTKLLARPETCGLELDSPRTTELRRDIIRKTPFLCSIYREWYTLIASALSSSPRPVLELGSGGGFMAEVVPRLITSELFSCPHVHVVLDGQHLPFADSSLDGVVMTNVLHHLPEVNAFLHEASRCVSRGGVIAMIEPWVTPWSRWVYTHLHHEPFDPDAAHWRFPSSGPLSGANGALPWMVFQRDAERFHREHPNWVLERLEPMMPFRYLVSGGVSRRCFMPGWSTPPWRALERLFAPWMLRVAMFAFIVLRRR